MHIIHAHAQFAHHTLASGHLGSVASRGTQRQASCSPPALDQINVIRDADQHVSIFMHLDSVSLSKAVPNRFVFVSYIEIKVWILDMSTSLHLMHKVISMWLVWSRSWTACSVIRASTRPRASVPVCNVECATLSSVPVCQCASVPVCKCASVPHCLVCRTIFGS